MPDAVLRGGERFQHRSVAKCYRARPDYPAAPYTALLALLPDSPRTILDVGCGPGKLALGLADRGAGMERVDGVDASAAMLRAARAAAGERADVRWMHARFEDAPWMPGESAIDRRLIDRMVHKPAFTRGGRYRPPTADDPVLSNPRFRQRGRQILRQSVSSSVDDCIACLHSRQTFVLEAMGAELAQRFDTAPRSAYSTAPLLGGLYISATAIFTP